MTKAHCHNCGGPKPDDKYRACGECRFAWRLQKRIAGGPAETIEQLRAENAQLKNRIAELEGTAK